MPETLHDPAEMSFADAEAELDAIITAMDSSTVDVDRLGEQYARAVDIIRELDRRIVRQRQRIEELSVSLDAVRSGQAPAAVAPESPTSLPATGPVPPRPGPTVGYDEEPF